MVFGDRKQCYKLIIVGNVGNLFEIKFLQDEIQGTGDTYKIHIPLVTKRNTLSYNNIDELSNPILAVLPKELQEKETLSPLEAWYLMKRRPTDWEQFMHHAYGGWVSNKKTLIAGFATSIDKAWVARASEVIEVELFRGISQDINRSKTPGFGGFNATNGCIQNFLSRYCMFGVTPSHHTQERILFNSEIPETATSENLIDLAAIPQDEDATQRMHVFHGVQVKDNQLVRTKALTTGSYVLNAVPFRKFLNEKRMVVQRASDQALPLRHAEKPLVKNLGGTHLQGINAICMSSEEVPLDSLIVSKSFQQKMLASRFVKKTYRLPPNTAVVNTFTTVSQEEIAAALSLGAHVPRVRPGKTLFKYMKHELGAHEMRDEQGNLALTELMMKEKKMIEVATKEFLTPTKIQTVSGWDRSPCTVHQIEGLQLIDLKVGSKIIDLFSNKGTVCEIREDDDMPVVHIDDEYGLRVEVMYNPAIFRRKVAFSYKAAGLIGLQAYMKEASARDKQVLLNPQDSLKDVLKLMKDKQVKRVYDVTYKDETFKSARVSMQFFMHLDQDPERKFKHGAEERCRLTLIERQYLKKMGFNIKVNLRKPKAIGKAVGIDVTLANDIPSFMKSVIDEETFPNAFRISKRIDKEYLKTDIGLIKPEAVENTVADQRLKTLPGFVQTDLGRIYAPANMFSSLVNHKNSIILPTELVTLNAILAEQVSIDWLKSRIADMESEGKDSSDYGYKVALGKKKLQNLVDQYYNKLVQRFANEVSQAYNYRVPGIFGVATADNSLPMNTVGIPRFIHKKLKKFSNTHGMFRRHPIHRVYNCMPVNLVPVEGYTIRVNEKLMRLADGRKEIAVYKLRD
jgi:hypothetical protein